MAFRLEEKRVDTLHPATEAGAAEDNFVALLIYNLSPRNLEERHGDPRKEPFVEPLAFIARRKSPGAEGAAAVRRILQTRWPPRIYRDMKAARPPAMSSLSRRLRVTSKDSSYNWWWLSGDCCLTTVCDKGR